MTIPMQDDTHVSNRRNSFLLFRIIESTVSISLIAMFVVFSWFLWLYFGTPDGHGKAH